MEWVILNPSSIHETFGLLGYADGEGKYHIKDSCEDGLGDLLSKLENDNHYLRTRRTFGFTQTISKDILPLLSQASLDAPKIMAKVVKLLAQLTLPVECLMTLDFAETEEGQQIIFEIESLLTIIKTEFTKFKLTEVVVDFLKFGFEKAELAPVECEQIADGLLLLRNILHITTKEQQAQNQIIWNLFAHNLDKILLHLMTCSQSEWWVISLVQLISLIYKDQKVSTLQRLLSQYAENSLSESSEDNESNTSPQFGNSSPMLTSDPTSDSSDTGGNGNVNAEAEKDEESDMKPVEATALPAKCYSKTKKSKGHLMDTDSGVVSFNESEDVVEAKIQDSTSSTEDDVGQRVRSIWTKFSEQDKQKKKLHKQKIKSKSALKQHHHPTEEDISHVLGEFTVNFLLNGYSSLVCTLQDQLAKNAGITMDRSHYFWLITYFLKFSSQLELEWKAVSPVLDWKVLKFLTMSGVNMLESLAICKDDVKPHLRRLHLVVTSLREFLQTVDRYTKAGVTEGSDALNVIQRRIHGCKELRYLFVLLLRSFKPVLQTKQYLQDVITTNHQLLVLLESVNHVLPGEKFQMMDYLKEFANPLIMQQYGHLLEDFEKNGEHLNDCLFTMMHHVAGDLNAPDSLFQPLILKTFCNIWEVEFEIRDDWADLIEFIIQKFMKASKDEKRQIFKSGTSNFSEETGFSKDDIEQLYRFYASGASSKDPIGAILENYKPCSLKTRESVLNQLLHQRIIGYNQFLQYLSSERMETNVDLNLNSNDDSFKDAFKFNCFGGNLDAPKYERSGTPEGDVSETLGQTRSDGLDVKWIQDQVLECCYAKVVHEGKMSDIYDCEPIAYQSLVIGQSVPLVPWTKKQEYTMNSSSVVLLLHKLGFYLASDIGKLYPRIPHFWPADVLYNIAEKLGPVPETKFDKELVYEEGVNMDCTQDSDHVHGYLGHRNYVSDLPNPSPPMDWMLLVQKSKIMMGGRMDEEIMDECASLTALPPTEVSGNVSINSDEIYESGDL